MLKLAIIAGISLSALLCGMMALGGGGGSNGLFQSGNTRNFEFFNDIKEIFGFPPKSQNTGTTTSQFTSKTGDAPSSFSFGGGSNDGSYLPPKSFAEDDYNYTDLTTPLFRIFVLSTSTPETPTTSSTSTITTTTGNPTTQTTTTSATTTSTTPTAASSITPTTFTPSINATEPSNRAAFKEEALAEGTTVSSISSSPSPTGYAFQRNPSPQFKVDLIWSTLVPPSVSNAENEVAMNGNIKPTSDNAGTGYGGGSPPNNGLYLPPNKEYLPPSSQ